jgi:hypothetical protein
MLVAPFGGKFLGGSDVAALAAFVAAGQQHEDFGTALLKIYTISRPVMNAQLTD